ncbi:hypothetical protein [Lentibacillus sp. CBA3610]|uniref:hypothetical protein n=1 Tax=Lentibacillus sp. CBA3610 TaxID=2518176 RepID=UPI0015961834|nr:hypothetical protein [Lentibacillus sp. CBA3610]QKY68469.1 hypothetical protein Len3610_01515 [Lentibacillus sp. CBA3610]
MMSEEMKVILTEIQKMNNRLDTMQEDFDRRFDGIDNRFVAIDERFNEIDNRFVAIDERFDEMDDKLMNLEDQLRIVREQTAKNYEFQTAIERTFNDKVMEMESDIKLLKKAVIH